jgi:hypothetical protein
VVDNARRMISKNIDIVVTSVLQTTAGKMIFGRYIEGPGQPAPAPAAVVPVAPPQPTPNSTVIPAGAARAQQNAK